MAQPAVLLPYLTTDLPGVGGQLRQTDDDFRVEEILAYEPDGSGDHVFVQIEKVGRTTQQAASDMARALSVRLADVGWAGLKDKRAVTRQTLSFPPPCTPQAVAALDVPGIAVLSATRHRHKLRTGHLRGNRFVLKLRQADVNESDAALRARAILDRLSRPPGSPNWFGAQRFGRDGKNAEIGRALVQGGELPTGMKAPRGRARRLYISALQSLLYNEYLRRRIEDGLFDRVIVGDVLQKVSSGGLFVSDQVERDQTRLDGGEVVPTGPMFGHKVKLPPDGSFALERELSILDRHGLAVDAFARVGKLGVGTRRPIAVRLHNAVVEPIDERAIELSFAIPAGSYATAVMREVVKGSVSFPG